MADWGRAVFSAYPACPVEMTVAIQCGLSPAGPPGSGAHRISTPFAARVAGRPPLRGYLDFALLCGTLFELILLIVANFFLKIAC